MAERSSFFNSVNGDRKYSATNFAEYFSSFIGNGVFPDPSDGLKVISNNNMTVTVKSGQAWINGYYYHNDSDLILALENADGVLNRIDRIVIQFDITNRIISAKVIKGTFASNPSGPALRRNADLYELGVAEIYVHAGATSIITSNILDLRSNKDLCGTVNSTIAQVDTSIFLTKMINLNLILNGGFQFWQRGSTFNTVANKTIYTADRWGVNSGSVTGLNISKVTDGFKLTWNAVCNGVITYRIEDKTALMNKEVTLSISVNGVIYSYTTTLTTSLSYIHFNLDGKTFEVRTGSDTGLIDISHYNAPIGTTYTINFIKLEFGDIATPIIKTPHLDAKEEMACKRYFQKVAVPNQVILTDSYQASIHIPLKVSMRVVPTIDSSPSGIWLHAGNGAAPFDFGSNITSIQEKNGDLMLESTTVGVAANGWYGVNQSNQAGNNSSGLGLISLDAEIY